MAAEIAALNGSIKRYKARLVAKDLYNKRD